MNILFLMGGSGTGKTTLSDALIKANPNKFNKIIPSTTRDKRPEETDTIDYFFINDEKYNESKFFEKVEYQFFPKKYGATENQLKKENNIWNVIVVSIEGYLSAMKYFRENTINNTKFVLLNLISNTPFIEREGRNSSSEEKINKAVLYNLKKDNNHLILNDTEYYEVDANLFFNKTPEERENIVNAFLNKEISLTTKLKSVNNINELKDFFMKNSNEIINNDLLDLLDIKCRNFGISVKELTELCIKTINQ